MHAIINSRILGAFHGWLPDEIYMLQDGTNWQLVSPVMKSKWLQSPHATVFRNGNRFYLQVKGMGPRDQTGAE